MEAFVPADLLASTEDTRCGRKRSSAARIHRRRWSVSRCVRRSTLRRLAAAPTRRYRRWPESTYRRAAAPNISRRLAPIMSTIAASRRCSSNTGAFGAYRHAACFSLPESGKASVWRLSVCLSVPCCVINAVATVRRGMVNQLAASVRIGPCQLRLG